MGACTVACYACVGLSRQLPRIYTTEHQASCAREGQPLRSGAVLPPEELPRAAGLASSAVSEHRRLFGLLFGINVLNYADRFTLPAVAPLIAVSLHLSDTQLGLLGTAFLL